MVQVHDEKFYLVCNEWDESKVVEGLAVSDGSINDDVMDERDRYWVVQEVECCHYCDKPCQWREQCEAYEYACGNEDHNGL